MKLKYIYIDKYGDIINDLNLNLGGEYTYTYNGSRIYKTKNKEYISNFYGKYSVIDEITGIIGKNSSGKTTVLRLINNIFSFNEKNFKFIIILEIEGELFYSTNISNINENSLKYINHNKLLQLKDINLIFFSSIFDKSSNLSSNNRLIDISTNKLLRVYSNNHYDSIKDIYELHKKKDILDEEIDIIDSFKRQEILKLFRYFIKVNKSSKFKPLVKLPQHLNISYADSTEEKINKIIKLKNQNKQGYKGLKAINDLTDVVLFDYTEVDSRRQYKNEFILMLMFEVFYRLIIYDTDDIEAIIYEFVDRIYGQEDEIKVESIAFDILEKIINNELDKDIYIVNDLNIFEKNIDDEISNLSDKSINNIDIALNIIEDINNDIDDFIYNIEEGYINEITDEICNNLVIKINDIIEFKDDISDDIYKFLNTIKKYIVEIKDSVKYEHENYIFEEVLEEIYLNNNLIKNKLIDIDKILNNDDYIIEELEEDTTDEIYEEYNEENYSEVNEKVINFIRDIQKIIKLILDIIDKNQVNKELENILNLKVEWKNKNNNVIDFIRKFENLNLETFYLVYDHQDLSSGQNSYLDMLSRLIDNYEMIKNNKHTIFLIDEGDINLHPEIQIKFIKNLLEFLSEFFSDNKFHIILTSNSPFIISDLLNSNIIYLERETMIKNSDKDISKLRTFGANINELLIDSFFMENGSIGEFAQDRIDYIIKSLNKGKSNETEGRFLKQNIDIIGDQILREKLLDMYKSVYGISQADIKNKIEFYKNKILELERLNELHD